MTMPQERTRALRWAGECMREALNTPEVPEELKHQIRMILRHYPSSEDIARRAMHGPKETFRRWLEPED